MGAHLVDAEVVQVGGEARLRLEARGGKGRCGQTGCAGAEGTREISERQLGGGDEGGGGGGGGGDGGGDGGLSCREGQGAGRRTEDRCRAGRDRYVCATD